MTQVRDFMHQGAITVSSSYTLPQLEQAFIDHKITGFPVIEAGRLVGVVSRSDVVRQICVERTKAEYISDFYCDKTGFHTTLDDSQSLSAIAQSVGSQIDHLHVSDVMTTRLITVNATDAIETAAQLMVSHDIHRLPVLSDGAVAGMITSLDVVRYVAGTGGGPC